MSHNPQPHRWPKPLVAVEDMAAEDPEVASSEAHPHLCPTSGSARSQRAPAPGPGDTSSTHRQQLQVCTLCGVLNETGEEKTQRSLRARSEAAGRLTRNTSVFTFWVKRSSVSQVTLNSLQNVGMSGVHL